jgi:hypothetical protein
MNLLKKLDVVDPLLVIGDDVSIFDTRKSVAVFKVTIGVLTECFITSHSYSGEVVSVARTIIGHLVVGRVKARQSCLGGDALCWEVIKPQEWCLAHHKGEVPRHVVFIAPGGTAAMLYTMSHILGSE